TIIYGRWIRISVSLAILPRYKLYYRTDQFASPSYKLRALFQLVSRYQTATSRHVQTYLIFMPSVLPFVPRPPERNTTGQNEIRLHIAPFRFHIHKRDSDLFQRLYSSPLLCNRILLYPGKPYHIHFQDLRHVAGRPADRLLFQYWF